MSPYDDDSKKIIRKINTFALKINNDINLFYFIFFNF